ncbi:MAG TPA: phospholipase D-like domain-containing protein, partial [Bdellovibrionota bacterium]|nr:phospholipase D-like domain-containing protein [Bdellovibrionota bacterium]
SGPAETLLGGLDGIAVPKDLWVEMIDGARKTLEFGEFYASHEAGQALEPVLQAVERAGARGVKIRFLFDKGMIEQDRAVYERIKAIRNATVRYYDIKPLTGGIIHAKYFIVDTKEFFVGSQNFDWRALSQIHETGARVEHPLLAAQLLSNFEIDWKIAETGRAPTPPQPTQMTELPQVEIVAAPPQFNPQGMRPSLEALLELFKSAKTSLKIQVMSYSLGRNRAWPVIDDAIRAAAARGVKVKMMVADWTTGEPSITDLKALGQVPGIELKIVTIPQHSSGCIPFSRVIHSKYMVVDGQTLWLGTSNWSKSYFDSTRGIELVFRNRMDLALQGDAIFEQLWASPYAEMVDPTRVYVTPDRECTGRGN